jgi:hypothetical protein
MRQKCEDEALSIIVGLGPCRIVDTAGKRAQCVGFGLTKRRLSASGSPPFLSSA